MEGRVFLDLFWRIKRCVFLAGIIKSNVKSDKINQMRIVRSM